MRFLKLFASTASAASLSVVASATVLTFDDGDTNDYAFIPQAYGDNVAATTAGAFSYGAAGGFTPDVSVAYVGTAGSGQDDLNLWTSGFSDLTNVVEFEPDGYAPWHITFSGSNGQGVRLDSFDLGNYGGAVTLPGLTITDGANHVLWSRTNLAIPDGSTPGHLTFSPGVVGASLTLTVDATGLGGNTDNIGLDNIQFGQQPVPEPATMVALGLGLAGVLRRRKR